MIRESTTLKDLNMGKVKRQYRYFTAKVLEGHKANGTDRTLMFTINRDQTSILADQSTSHVDISKKSSGQATKEILRWVHITISYASGIWWTIITKYNEKNLQLYLNEFVQKLNCGYFGEQIFNRLVIANITMI